jgi:hypothetical protein
VGQEIPEGGGKKREEGREKRRDSERREGPEILSLFSSPLLSSPPSHSWVMSPAAGEAVKSDKFSQKTPTPHPTSFRPDGDSIFLSITITALLILEPNQCSDLPST